jgi:hypothetical protein
MGSVITGLIPFNFLFFIEILDRRVYNASIKGCGIVPYISGIQQYKR